MFFSLGGVRVGVGGKIVRTFCCEKSDLVSFFSPEEEKTGFEF